MAIDIVNLQNVLKRFDGFSIENEKNSAEQFFSTIQKKLNKVIEENLPLTAKQKEQIKLSSIELLFTQYCVISDAKTAKQYQNLLKNLLVGDIEGDSFPYFSSRSELRAYLKTQGLYSSEHDNSGYLYRAHVKLHEATSPEDANTFADLIIDNTLKGYLPLVLQRLNTFLASADEENQPEFITQLKAALDHPEKEGGIKLNREEKLKLIEVIFTQFEVSDNKDHQKFYANKLNHILGFTQLGETRIKPLELGNLSYYKAGLSAAKKYLIEQGLMLDNYNRPQQIRKHAVRRLHKLVSGAEDSSDLVKQIITDTVNSDLDVTSSSRYNYNRSKRKAFNKGVRKLASKVKTSISGKSEAAGNISSTIAQHAQKQLDQHYLAAFYKVKNTFETVLASPNTAIWRTLFTTSMGSSRSYDVYKVLSSLANLGEHDLIISLYDDLFSGNTDNIGAKKAYEKLTAFNQRVCAAVEKARLTAQQKVIKQQSAELNKYLLLENMYQGIENKTLSSKSIDFVQGLFSATQAPLAPVSMLSDKDDRQALVQTLSDVLAGTNREGKLIYDESLTLNKIIELNGSDAKFQQPNKQSSQANQGLYYTLYVCALQLVEKNESVFKDVTLSELSLLLQETKFIKLNAVQRAIFINDLRIEHASNLETCKGKIDGFIKQLKSGIHSFAEKHDLQKGFVNVRKQAKQKGDSIDKYNVAISDFTATSNELSKRRLAKPLISLEVLNATYQLQERKLAHPNIYKFSSIAGKMNTKYDTHLLAIFSLLKEHQGKYTKNSEKIDDDPYRELTDYFDNNPMQDTQKPACMVKTLLQIFKMLSDKDIKVKNYSEIEKHRKLLVPLKNAINNFAANFYVGDVITKQSVSEYRYYDELSEEEKAYYHPTAINPTNEKAKRRFTKSRVENGRWFVGLFGAAISEGVVPGILFVPTAVGLVALLGLSGGLAFPAIIALCLFVGASGSLLNFVLFGGGFKRALNKLLIDGIFVDNNGNETKNTLKRGLILSSWIFGLSFGICLGVLSGVSMFAFFSTLPFSLPAALMFVLSGSVGFLFCLGVTTLFSVEIADLFVNNRHNDALAFLEKTFLLPHFFERTFSQQMRHVFNIISTAVFMSIGLFLAFSVTVASGGLYFDKGVKLLSSAISLGKIAPRVILGVVVAIASVPNGLFYFIFNVKFSRLLLQVTKMGFYPILHPIATAKAVAKGVVFACTDPIRATAYVLLSVLQVMVWVLSIANGCGMASGYATAPGTTWLHSVLPGFSDGMLKVDAFSSGSFGSMSANILAGRSLLMSILIPDFKSYGEMKSDELLRKKAKELGAEPDGFKDYCNNQHKGELAKILAELNPITLYANASYIVKIAMMVKAEISRTRATRWTTGRVLVTAAKSAGFTLLGLVVSPLLLISALADVATFLLVPAVQFIKDKVDVGGEQSNVKEEKPFAESSSVLKIKSELSKAVTPFLHEQQKEEKVEQPESKEKSSSEKIDLTESTNLDPKDMVASKTSGFSRGFFSEASNKPSLKLPVQPIVATPSA